MPRTRRGQRKVPRAASSRRERGAPEPERAHVGSASWVEAPTYLGEFAHGTMNDYSGAQFETAVRSGGRTQRMSPTVVND